MEVNINDGRMLPTEGYARVGNFKLWKSVNASDGVSTIVISDMSGSWSVQVPQTYLAYPMIEQLYSEGNEEMLHTYIANVNFVSAIFNGYYQRAVSMVGHCYMKPELLREGYSPADGPGHGDLLDEAGKIRDGFLEWCEGVLKEERAREARTGVNAIDEDEMADKAAEILSKEEK